MSDEFRINGNLHSWGSLKVKVSGDQFTGFTGISFGDKLERVMAYGMGKHQAPRAISRGKYSTEPIKLSGPPSTIQQLRDGFALGSSTGTNYADVVAEIVLQYFENGIIPITVEMHGVRWAANSANHEESADPLKEEIELTCMAIRRNGKVLFDDSEGSPF